MTNEIDLQLISALFSVASGFAAGLLYDTLRLIREIFRPLTFILDLLFWLLFASAVFLVGLMWGAGEVRLYMLLLALAGLTLYFFTLSRFARIVTDSALKALRRLKSLIGRRAGKIVVFFENYLKKMQKIAKNIFHSANKWSTIYAKKRSVGKKTTGKEDTVVETKSVKYFYEGGSVQLGGLRDSVVDGTVRKDRRSRAAKRRIAL